MQKLLIANRGEIAVRIIRTARELGIRTVVVASEPDADTYAARLADEVVVIGPASAAQSYLNHDAVLAAAADTGCDAVHPGYGFLSENATFAGRVQDAGLVWVGPSAGTIELMGNKSRARAAAETAGVPTLRGSAGTVGSGDELIAEAATIGYPMLVKASAGGGGRGIRFIASEADLLSTVGVAQAEAQAAFGSSDVYLERFVQNARHVEVQILGDGFDAIHLGDRDCSMQRRQQKVMEEAPAPDLPDEVRERIRSSSVELARRSQFQGLGTVEFLYDPATHEAAFIEMNTRLQVEHPVTEMVTGLDLVREQLLVAAGGSLRHTQDDIEFRGHSLEFRINAEDPTNKFMPSPGTLSRVDWPGGPGIRVDSGVVAGSVVAPYYDSLLAKMIVWDTTREEAIARSSRALDEIAVDGVKTTVGMLAALVARPEFRDVQHHSTFIENTPDLLGATS